MGGVFTCAECRAVDRAEKKCSVCLCRLGGGLEGLLGAVGMCIELLVRLRVFLVIAMTIGRLAETWFILFCDVIG